MPYCRAAARARVTELKTSIIAPRLSAGCDYAQRADNLLSLAIEIISKWQTRAQIYLVSRSNLRNKQLFSRSMFTPTPPLARWSLRWGDFDESSLTARFSDDAASIGSAWPFGSKSGYLSYWAVLTSVFSHYGTDNKNFPPLIRNRCRGRPSQTLLTSPNAEGSVEIIQIKEEKKMRQASPACHRCPGIDFLPVSWRKWVRNYCLARGSTKLDSLCVCSQQSVSKVNLDWLWSKHIFI